MKYEDVLKKVKKTHICPFCNKQKKYILDQNRYFYVTVARAPYVANHLLIIPNKHVKLFHELSAIELKHMFALTRKWTEKLHKIYKDIAILLRDGPVISHLGKSVNHLHLHLVPDCEIGPLQNGDGNREFYDEKIFNAIIAKTKKLLSK